MLVGGAVDIGAVSTEVVGRPIQGAANLFDNVAVIKDILTCLIVFGNDVDVFVIVDGEPIASQGVIEAGVDTHTVVPIGGDIKRRDDN